MFNVLGIVISLIEQIKAMNAPLVWIADEDKDDCSFYEQAFHDIDKLCVVRIFNDGQSFQQALHQLKNPLPDLLIIDGYMTEKSGMNILRLVSDHPGLMSLNVTVVSAPLPAAQQSLAESMKAKVYFKPYSVEELKGLVRTLLSGLTCTMIMTLAA